VVGSTKTQPQVAQLIPDPLCNSKARYSVIQKKYHYAMDLGSGLYYAFYAKRLKVLYYRTDPGSNLIENGYNKYTDWLIVNPKSQLEELDPGSGVVTDP